MENFITPIGLKVSCSSVKDLDNLFALADDLKSYHLGKFVIGRDSQYCESSHYHIHFWSHKVVSKDAIKVFKSNKLLKKYNLKRTDKIYLGQDLPSADKNAWLGYAIKEEIVSITGFDCDHVVAIKKCADTQLEIKKLKAVKSEQIKEKEKEKKQFKEKMFSYISDEYKSFCIKNFKELEEKYDTKSGCVIPENDPYIIKCMIVQFLMENDKYGSIRRIFIDNYYKEYLGKYLGKNCFEIFSLI